MSRLMEYLKLLPRAIANVDKIIEGYRNEIKLEHGNLPEDEVEEIIRRRLICDTCPLNSKNAVTAGWYKSERLDEHCTVCLCPIIRKTACLTCNCGAEYHNQTKPNEPPLELKWYSYVK